MQFKRTLNGLTLVEILLSLVIAAMILVFLVPQQLQATHEQLVDKTVAQMTQLVLAARNYYQDNRAKVSSNALAWPNTLTQLTSSGYLPSAALCSAWPKGPATQQGNANNNGKDCGNHQEYALFPANSSTGSYDTTVPGIATSGSNSGGNFWGVSIALPTAKAAEEVRERMPFATTCPPSDLSKTSTPCSTSSNIVTAVVPRPAQWPGLGKPATYAKDGLIQSMGSVVLCDNTNSSYSCSKNVNSVNITRPNTCGVDENNNPLTAALFIYPLSYQWNQTLTGNSKKLNNNYPGIQLQVVYNSNNWTVIAGESGQNKLNTNNFKYISLAYFTVCQPYNPATGPWTLGFYSNT